MLLTTQSRYCQAENSADTGLISIRLMISNQPTKSVFQLDKVIGLQRLPALLSSVRAEHGERAEAVLLQTIRSSKTDLSENAKTKRERFHPEYQGILIRIYRDSNQNLKN